jgi:hypothetical protein
MNFNVTSAGTTIDFEQSGAGTCSRLLMRRRPHDTTKDGGAVIRSRRRESLELDRDTSGAALRLFGSTVGTVFRRPQRKCSIRFVAFIADRFPAVVDRS